MRMSAVMSREDAGALTCDWQTADLSWHNIIVLFSSL